MKCLWEGDLGTAPPDRISTCSLPHGEVQVPLKLLREKETLTNKVVTASQELHRFNRYPDLVTITP